MVRSPQLACGRPGSSPSEREQREADGTWPATSGVIQTGPNFHRSGAGRERRPCPEPGQPASAGDAVIVLPQGTPIDARRKCRRDHRREHRGRERPPAQPIAVPHGGCRVGPRRPGARRRRGSQAGAIWRRRAVILTVIFAHSSLRPAAPAATSGSRSMATFSTIGSGVAGNRRLDREGQTALAT